MTDHFAALGVPRRPWLDPEALREKFHRLASEHHPDIARGSAIDFAALNTAHAILREPHIRIRHLLELEFPGTAIPAAIPPAIADIFMEVGQLLRDLASFITRLEKTSSPLARALLAGEKSALRERADKWSDSLSALAKSRADDLRAIDAEWPAPSCPPRLAALQPQLAYLAKWTAQLREAMHQLEL